MTTYTNNHEYCCGAYVDCRTGVTEMANCNHPRMQQRVGHVHNTLTRTPKQLVQQPQFHHHFHHHLHQQQQQPLPHLPQPALLNFQQTHLESHRVPQYSSCTLPASTKSRGKFTNLRDSVKKSPTKSTAKVRASSSALWLANSWGTFSLDKVCGRLIERWCCKVVHCGRKRSYEDLNFSFNLKCLLYCFSRFIIAYIILEV